MNRRHFLHAGALATLAGTARGATTEGKPLRFSAVGIASGLDNAAALKAAGAEFLTESTGRFLVPDQPDEAFEKNLAMLAESPLPVLACNSFIRPPHLRCVGKDATHDQVLEWAETCFRRLKQAKGRFIVFGSSGSRELRDGFPKEKADEQFVALLKRMGPLAKEHGVTVVLEQLRADECNYINRIGEAAAIVRATDHPNVRMLADFYHMACMGDTPADLRQAMDVVVHLEIAEKEGRAAPGTHGEDFRPYFSVLREQGYDGTISIEGRWEIETVGKAFEEIRRQAGEA